MKIKPGPTAEPIVCQACDGCGWVDGGKPCPRLCSENGLTTIYECDCCNEEHDLRDEKTFSAKGVRVTPALVTYSVGPHVYHYCEFCAPAEAIGDGEGLRAMLRDLRAMKRHTDRMVAGPDWPSTVGVLVGHAASLEQAVLDLCEQCGVAAS
jgi:hypothetical protein